ncbi:CLUMA_CG014467, isoform A [Clunio marinus]|uniref:Tetraspanin n=1 Tax=Clunio marinus TaxID=568069 RepID=A0A1J1IQH4_9DIPT|nr:CLUMA_CG014467, isoform A [Clunio marinus]
MSDHLQTPAAMGFIKSMLVGFNIAFWVSGLALLCSGIWVQIGLHRYMELSTDYTNTFQIVLVGLGLIILFVGTLACCCTVKAQSSLLYLYAGFLTIILMIELAIAAGLYTYKDHLADGLQQGLNQSIRNYGPDYVMKSADFDAMQENLGCCGNVDYKDWYSLNPPRPVPRSCCKQPGPVRCDTQDETQIYNLGCYMKVTQYLERNMGRIAITALCVALFPLVGSILSIALAKNINKAKYEQMA